MSTNVAQSTTAGEMVPLPDPQPLALIQAAIAKGIDAEQLGKLLDLQERFERNLANTAFNLAMAEAQEQMPVVVRNKVNSHTKSKYADLEAVISTIKPIYGAAGFSLSFSEEKSEAPGCVRVVCDVSHRCGCTRRFSGEFPLDGVGSKGNANMTGIQSKGSTLRYARRYLTLGIFNVTEADEDTDGNAEGTGLNPEQVREINDLIAACADAGKPVEYRKFLAWLEPTAGDLSDVPQRRLDLALDYLTKKLKGGGAK